jgi:hypothetical protein
MSAVRSLTGVNRTWCIDPHSVENDRTLALVQNPTPCFDRMPEKGWPHRSGGFVRFNCPWRKARTERVEGNE